MRVIHSVGIREKPPSKRPRIRSRVKCKQGMSDPIDITKGVNQDNVLSPLLFYIFINDLGDDIIDSEAPMLYD